MSCDFSPTTFFRAFCGIRSAAGHLALWTLAHRLPRKSTTRRIGCWMLSTQSIGALAQSRSSFMASQAQGPTVSRWPPSASRAAFFRLSEPASLSPTRGWAGRGDETKIRGEEPASASNLLRSSRSARGDQSLGSPIHVLIAFLPYMPCRMPRKVQRFETSKAV